MIQIQFATNRANINRWVLKRDGEPDLFGAEAVGQFTRRMIPYMQSVMRQSADAIRGMRSDMVMFDDYQDLPRDLPRNLLDWFNPDDNR